MPSIIYIEHDGTSHTVEAPSGTSVMDAAVKRDVPGILAECGGSCACATCHVYVASEWRAAVGEPSDMEISMLEFAHEPRPESRLSCQIRITDALDGLVVRLPEVQG